MSRYPAEEKGVYTSRIKVDLAEDFHYLCPAPLAEETIETLNWLTAATFRITGCLDVARVDFRLDAKPELPSCWIEVKSVTLVDPSTDLARFPDAPTQRGQRHLRELIEVVGKGDRAAVIFVVQRDDAQQFAPHDQADPAFGQALRQAAQAGVEIQAWRCQVSLEAIQLCDAIPVVL